jgi:hypothetical protein
MIYHFSLQSVAVVTGIILLVLGLTGLILPSAAQSRAKRLPRSFVAGVVLLTIDLAWSLWLIGTMEMGEFQAFRRPLLIALPVGYFLVLRFVDEFLSVRALGILCLLAAEPLLDAAFLRDERARLVITTFAYLLIVAGIIQHNFQLIQSLLGCGIIYVRNSLALVRKSGQMQIDNENIQGY